MLRKRRAISTFLILSLSFLFLLASAYSNYNTLIEADFLTQGTKYEAGDLDNLWVDKPIHWDFMPSESFVIASPEINLQGVLLAFSYQVISIDSSFFVLRC
jgi:hypothetical protein